MGTGASLPRPPNVRVGVTPGAGAEEAGALYVPRSREASPPSRPRTEPAGRERRNKSFRGGISDVDSAAAAPVTESGKSRMADILTPAQQAHVLSMVELSQDTAVLRFDENLRITYAGGATKAMLGMDAAEAMSSNLRWTYRMVHEDVPHANEVWGHRQPVILHYRRSRVGVGTFWVQGMLSTSEADGGFGLVMERRAPSPPPTAGVAGGAADFQADPLPFIPGDASVSAQPHHSVQSAKTPTRQRAMVSDRSTDRGRSGGREANDDSARSHRRSGRSHSHSPGRSPRRSPRRSARHGDTRRLSGQLRSSRSSGYDSTVRNASGQASAEQMGSERSATSTSRRTGRGTRSKRSPSQTEHKATGHSGRGARTGHLEGGVTRSEASLLRIVHSQFGISAEADSAHLASATLRFLAQSAVDALMLLIMDARGNVVFASRGMARVLECAAEELLGRESWSLIHGDDIRRLASVPASTRSDESGPNYRFRRVGPGGGEGVWVEAVARTVQVTSSALYSVSLEWRLSEGEDSVAGSGHQVEGGDEAEKEGAAMGGGSGGSQGRSWAEGGPSAVVFLDPHSAHPRATHSTASSRPRPAQLPRPNCSSPASAQPHPTTASVSLPVLRNSDQQQREQGSEAGQQHGDAPSGATHTRFDSAALYERETAAGHLPQHQHQQEEWAPTRRRLGPRNEAIASIEVTTGPALEGATGLPRPDGTAEAGSGGTGSWPVSDRTGESAEGDTPTEERGSDRGGSLGHDPRGMDRGSEEKEEEDRDSQSRSGAGELAQQPLDMASPVSDAVCAGTGRRVARLSGSEGISGGSGARPDRPLGGAAAPTNDAGAGTGAGEGHGDAAEEKEEKEEGGEQELEETGQGSAGVGGAGE